MALLQIDWKKLVVVLVVMALLGLAITHYRSDRRLILRELAALTALLDKDGPEQPLGAWGVARRVPGFFTPVFVVRAAPYEGRIADPQELAAAAHRFRAAADQVSVTVGQRELRVRDNETAVLDFVATVTLRHPERAAREIYRVRSQWQKDEGRWRINELELVEVLEGPGLLGI